MILCLETATPTCSVAINDGNRNIALRECKGQNAHSEKITIFINEVMKEVGLDYSELDAVAVSQGPGSYTGLRIGVSTAKGICYAAGLPLLAIDTLHAMAYGIKDLININLQPTDLLVPMIDARRMEVYCSIFDTNYNRVEDTRAVVFDEKEPLTSYLSSHTSLWLFGDGAPKLKPLFKDVPNIRIVDGFAPSAAYMATLADQAMKASEFVDVAYFEPFYLKDFVAGKPHVKGL